MPQDRANVADAEQAGGRGAEVLEGDDVTTEAILNPKNEHKITSKIMRHVYHGKRKRTYYCGKRYHQN